MPHLAAISEALNYDTVSCILIEATESFLTPELLDYLTHYRTGVVLVCVGNEILSPLSSGLKTLAKKFPVRVKSGVQAREQSPGSPSKPVDQA